MIRIILLTLLSTAANADTKQSLATHIATLSDSVEINNTAHFPDGLLPSADFLDRTHKVAVQGCRVTYTVQPVWADQPASTTVFDLTYADLNHLSSDTDPLPYFYVTKDKFRQNNRADFTFKMAPPNVAVVTSRTIHGSFQMPLDQHKEALENSGLEERYQEKPHISIFNLTDTAKPDAFHRALLDYQTAYCR